MSNQSDNQCVMPSRKALKEALARYHETPKGRERAERAEREREREALLSRRGMSNQSDNQRPESDAQHAKVLLEEQLERHRQDHELSLHAYDNAQEAVERMAYYPAELADSLEELGEHIKLTEPGECRPAPPWLADRLATLFTAQGEALVLAAFLGDLRARLEAYEVGLAEAFVERLECAAREREALLTGDDGGAV